MCNQHVLWTQLALLNPPQKLFRSLLTCTLRQDLDCPETVAVQITRAQLKKVIKRLPKGSAPGPSGWTYEHIQAVAQGTETGMDAVLAILAGDLPEWEWFTASRLVPLVKKVAHPGAPQGVRPIAIGEVWARLVSMCAMAACLNIGPSLACLLYTSPSPRD